MLYWAAFLALAATPSAASRIPYAVRASNITSNETSSSANTTNSTSVNSADPPIWNLGNTHCGTRSYADPKPFWELVKGDEVVKNVTDAFTNNKVFCSECMGIDMKDCPQAQQDHPNFDSNCTRGLRDQSGGRWDNAVAHYAVNAALTDVKCSVNTYDCMARPECDACNGPSTWAVLESVATVNNFFNNLYQALEAARSSATNQMDQFSKDFAPIPKDSVPPALFTSLMGSIFGGVGGMVSLTEALAPEAIVFSMVASLSAGLAGNLIPPTKGVPKDVSKILGTMVDSAQDALTKLTDDLFVNGSATWDKGADGSTGMAMADIMKDGFGLQDVGNKTFEALKGPYEKLIYQQLAHYTWHNLQDDAVDNMPFIAFENGPCGKTTDSLSEGDNAIIPDMDRSSAVDMDGRCYYLLAARLSWEPMKDKKPFEHGFGEHGGKTKYCNGYRTPPGATHQILDGKAYAGLTVEDFIRPSVSAWKDNKNQNGWKPAYQDQLVKDIQQSGTTQIPVCDYLKDSSNPGKDCPNLGDSKSLYQVCNKF